MQKENNLRKFNNRAITLYVCNEKSKKKVISTLELS